MDSDALSPWNTTMQRFTRSTGATPSGGVVLDDPDKAGFRFTKTTKEYDFLANLFKNNSVKASDRPAAFEARYEIFNKIKADSFRNKFNDLKKEYGLGTKTGKIVSQCTGTRNIRIRWCVGHSKICCRYLDRRGKHAKR